MNFVFSISRKIFIGGILLIIPVHGWSVTTGPVKIGGQFRSRYEVASPGVFTGVGAGRSRDQFLLRTRLHGKTTFPDQNLGVFIEIQDSRVSGSEASVSANSGNVDLHQGYLDILKLTGRDMDLRVGRQVLSYGDQRLVSPLDWNNVGRSWDGVKLTSQWEVIHVDAFMTIVNEVSDFYEDLKFSGLYGSFQKINNLEWDVYTFSRHSGKSTRAGAGASSNLDEWTTGSRVKGKLEAFDYSGEVVIQLGESAGKDINAYALAGTAGLTLPEFNNSRFGLGYDLASGDSSPTDNKVETFNPLFPFGHALQGHADLFSWKNGHDFYGNVTTKIKGIWTQVAFHNFWLNEDKDAWYNAGGAVVAQDPTGASGNDIGQELDIVFKAKFREIIDLTFGYARFWGGDFVKRNVSGSPDRDFAYVQGAISF